MMSNAMNHLMSELDIHPVLIDIGASGTPPGIWEGIASHSIYVGFDPDERDIREMNQGHFMKAVTVNKALTSDENDEVIFNLTVSPHCSSTLEPDSTSLSNYLFSDLFVVESQIRVQATSLNAVLQRFSLPRADWFKTDSQGTDLRLFNSLNPEIRSMVLAVDIEPGLIDAYVGEDLFVDAHKELTQNGFWLSNMNVCGAIRMRRSTLERMTKCSNDIREDLVTRTVRKSPGWCEARYFRTLEWLNDRDFAPRDYVLLWIFSILDGQLGFAIDLSVEYEKRFGSDDKSRIMQEEPVLIMRRWRRAIRLERMNALPARIMRRIVWSFKNKGNCLGEAG